MKSLDFVVAGRLLAAPIFALVVLVAALAPATAGEVRLGKNVRIGGHDFSNQTFDSKHRARIYLYNEKPRKEGCVWRKDGHGGRVKVCHLQRK
ncbi:MULTISPECIES: hypothetical protein [unclassified Rhizobium]|uniref:hypothetical protein n=1 Tax=unclassified Rhizobium TaxID=2613769 RepID=UPI000EAA59F4|nr:MULTISPECIES: hypothetical protein [unclassified Rhizobium]AYG67330.1 hypothetical protein CCGE531_15855 [Rhizobium sp. CCGE531]AYG73724.1 hypothetical protein CCGE532_15360 [Rhizobium sp. CCGE532]